MKKGSILLVDDDADDHHIVQEAVKELGIPNTLETFYESEKLIDYLLTHLTEQPFIILCDINLPKTNGIELKKKLDSYPELRDKSIPFVYYSTAAGRPILRAAYELQVQGFFTKKNSMDEVKKSLKLIFDYWSECKHPNNA